MFNLHVLNNDNLNNHIYAPVDLLKGFVKYKDLANQFGIEIFYHENVNTIQLKNVDGVFSLWGNCVDYSKQKYDFKIISFIDDIHWFNKQQLNSLIDRYKKTDLTFMPYYRSFIKYDIFSEFRDKIVSLFWWAPEYCNLINNDWNKRINKILLAGAHNEQVYKFREKIFNSKHFLLEKLPHCEYNKHVHQYYQEKFLDYCSKFRGMICTSLTPIISKNEIVHELNYTLKKILKL